MWYVNNKDAGYPTFQLAPSAEAAAADIGGEVLRSPDNPAPGEGERVVFGDRHTRNVGVVSGGDIMWEGRRVLSRVPGGELRPPLEVAVFGKDRGEWVLRGPWEVADGGAG